MISDLNERKSDLSRPKHRVTSCNSHVVGNFLFKSETSEQIKWKILMKSTDQLL